MKHNFCAYRAVLGRLRTDILSRLNLNVCQRCVLCRNELESHKHLIFNCSYNSYIWKRCRLKLGLRNRRSCSLISETGEFTRLFKVANQISYLAKLTYNVVIWFVWLEWNDRIFNNLQTHKVQLFQQIEYTISLRMAASTNFCKNNA